jgi:CopG family transcriptional regulator, nickel-responsive regulator
VIPNGNGRNCVARAGIECCRRIKPHRQGRGLHYENHELVVSTSHAHLDNDSCLEVLMVHGKSAKVEHFAERLIGLKGVQHGRLVMTVPAHAIEQPHSDEHGPNHKKIHKH